MVQTPVRQITLAEFLALPDTKPASEYIDGKVVQKSMPQMQHSVIQKQVLSTIDPILSDAGIAQAFLELQCIFDGWAIVPDVAVFEDERIPHDENGEIANIFSSYPDWIIEILSPDESTIKLLKNISYCLAHGTQMGWLIDPIDPSLSVCPIAICKLLTSLPLYCQYQNLRRQSS